MVSLKAPSFLILVVTVIGSLGNLLVSAVMSFILNPEVFKDYFLIVSSTQILANVVHFGGSNFYAFLIAKRVDKTEVINYILMHSFIIIPILGLLASVFLWARYPEISYVSQALLLTSFAIQGIVRSKLLLNERYVRAIILGVLYIVSIVFSVLLYQIFGYDLGFLFAVQGLLSLVLSYYFLGVKLVGLRIRFIPGSLEYMFYSMLNIFFVSVCMTGDRLLVDLLKPLDAIIYSYCSMIFGYMLIFANYSAGLWTNLLTLTYRKEGNLKNYKIQIYERKSFLLATVPVVLAYPAMLVLNFTYDVKLSLIDALGFATIIGLNILMKYYLALLNILGEPKVFSILCVIVLVVLLVVLHSMDELGSITDLLVLIVASISLVLGLLSFYTKRKIDVI